MDTSKDYVEMCLKAQEYFKPYLTDDYYLEQNDPINRYYSSLSGETPFHWCPRQDELQKIVWGYVDLIKFIIKKDSIVCETDMYEFESNSFEKLWLMLFMRDLHNKLWDPDEKEWWDRG